MADEEIPNQVIDSKDLNLQSCPSCKSAALRPALLLYRDGIPPGKEGHNIVYNHCVIVLCESCIAGFVEVRKHDCFDSEEVWDQDEWYVFDKDSGIILKEAVSGCPNPLSETCHCAVHESLRQVSLRVSDWTYGFEGDRHYHAIGISLKNNLPVFSKPKHHKQADDLQ
jgi:hypothetical protein